MKPLTYSIFAFFLVMARAGLAQPVVRIPADTFLAAISTHPDIRAHAEQIGLTGATTDSTAAEHLAFVYEFNKNAVLLYQQCWMLEQQMIENDGYRKDILSIRIIQRRLLKKQKLMVRESDRDRRDLEVKYADAVNALNNLTHHVFGKQPILPENCVLCFERDEQAQDHSGRDNIMSESVDDLAEKIAAQERLAFGRSSSDEAIMLMKEFYQMHIYKTQRWKAQESTAAQAAELFAREGFLFIDQASGGQ